MNHTSHRHTWVVLKLFVAHYRQVPLQAVAILVGIILAVTLFVAVQAINLNAKRSYSESTEQLSARAQSLIIPLSGQNFLPESLYFELRQSGLSSSLPVIEGKVRDEQGRRWTVQGSELVAAITSGLHYSETHTQVSLFNGSFPLPRLLAGEPIVMMSKTEAQRKDITSQITLDGVTVEVVILPDEWQLGSRLLMDIGFAQRLLNSPSKLSYIAVFQPISNTAPDFIAGKAQWITNTQETDLDALTESFHLNLTAMSLLAFVVGLFIAYNGVKYSLLKRNRLLVQMRQSGTLASAILTGLLLELFALVVIGSSIGFVLGIQLSHWLHPTVALTLEQLYGATLLPGTWQWQWWGQALLLTLTATSMACIQHFRQRINQPLSSHGGYYQAPENSNSTKLFVLGCLLSITALLGLGLSQHFRFTMAWLGLFIVSIPLYLPKVLQQLALWSEIHTQAGLIQYLFAELKELIAPLSLAMMALLLAVTANIGMNTLVGSFEFTLKQWLEQRLHADIYVSPSQKDMRNVEKKLEDFDGISTVYKQYYVDDTTRSTSIILGTKDTATLEQTMIFKSSVDDFWQGFYSGELAAISEPMAIKLDLDLEDELKLDGLPNHPLNVGAIFHDYGTPKGEVLISPTLWFEQGFTPIPTSLGVKVNSDKDKVYQALKEQLQLHPNQLYDQAQIKSIALDIFSRTFSVTSALNAVTLMIAVIGLFSACYMLLDARKAAIARLYALGVRRRNLMAMMIGQIAALVGFTLVIALPLGAIVGYVLTDIVTLRAFGWSLTYLWSWEDAVAVCVITLIVAVVATFLPLWRLVNRPVVSSLQSEVL
ncbi:hypothetical protein VIN01S_29380 [Vibrio inusitatus NBRC 102082]|uniref:ABC3 transporter permease C-terminal domain-containing protein n=1 Tax=Vibrio inusitatus NBRC 102082 TaxID=1219070 RepID=A0A4Y3I0Z2_9VIBR|nr:FtsX-like permease family protein [Vibrio inusitatus]GEA52134.1 hypothetical protein VIN01S_29380 [Vibrio inusitatus NBRC 102082]